MAGHTISLYFKKSGHDVTVFTRQRNTMFKSIVGDLKNFKYLEEVIISGQFDVIINAAGILNRKADEHKNEAVLINSYLPHFLSELTKNSSTKIIHMSTDCVFSGKTGGYVENSFRDGESFYDRTKALGEIINNKDLTFRCSIIGPDMNSHGIGLFNWFMKQKGKINGYKNVLWTGVTTITLAKAMEQACKENLIGLYNLVNNQPIDKYSLLMIFNETFRNNSIEIIESENPVLDKSLIDTRNDFNFKVPSYKEMINEMKNWIIENKNLYPFYFNEEVKF